MRLKSLLLIILLAVLLPQLATAYDFKVDGLCYNINDDGTSVTLTWETSPGSGPDSSPWYSYNSPTYYGLTGDIIIPNHVESNGISYNVTAIDSYCFNYCEDLESVIIPETIKTIGSYAFNHCLHLESISIPSSTSSIGTNPFVSCPAIETINVEAGNPYFDSRNNCDAIIATSSNILVSGCKNTIIPNGVSVIANCAFYGNGLSRFNLPESITMICDEAFSGCEICNCVLRIPNSVTYIGNDALPFLVDVYTIIIGESTQYIGKRAFANESTTDDTIRVVCLAETPPYLEFIPYKPTSHPFWWLGGGDYDNKMVLYVPDVDTYQYYSNIDIYHDWFFLVWDEVLPLSEYDGDIVPIFGDVDGDGVITSADVTALYNYLLNGDNTYLATGDVDGDGSITASDITATYNILLGN